jgi:hypothetical protein
MHMSAINWKAALAGVGVYFLATRPLLAYVLPGAPILLGDEAVPSSTLLWATLVWHALAAFAAGIATAAFAPGAELMAAPIMGALLALIDGTRALRLSQEPGERPGLLFLLILFAVVIAASTAGGWALTRIRGRKGAKHPP